MKSYTSIEQSKKLAEILPTESADMVYVSTGYSARALPKEDEDAQAYPSIVPCWSLAALLGVLPIPSLHKTCYGWRCDSYLKDGACCLFGENTDNPIDACVAAIGKLHEQKLL